MEKEETEGEINQSINQVGHMPWGCVYEDDKVEYNKH